MSVCCLLAVAGCGGGGSGRGDKDADLDAGADSGTDADGDAGGDSDTGTGTGTGEDGGEDAGEDASADAGEDAGTKLPPTTVAETIVGLLPAADQKGENRDKWGLTKTGPGEPYLPRDDLGVGDGTSEPLGPPSSIGYIWHITDAQICDEESPARLINGDSMYESAYRTQESWGALMLDAAVRTGNAFAAKRPFDFLMVTGDMVDNKQGNELSLFLGVLEGGEVNPDSAKDDDPIPGPGNDQHDPFEAEGVSPLVPWYDTLGNHDDLILGNFATLDWLVADPTGTIVSALSAAVRPTCLDHPWYPAESVTPARCDMPPKSYFKSMITAPDPARAFYSRDDWLAAHFGTRTGPDGHGFTEDNLNTGNAYYAIEGVLPGVPSRLIVLDTVAAEFQDGEIDDAQFAWFVTELDSAEAAGEVIIVASHHPVSWVKGKGAAFTAAMNAHPNVILHLAGHTHMNRITPHPAKNGDPPENGYWEVETSAMLVWPSQMRFVEIVDNRDGTGDIYCTMVNYRIPQGPHVLDGARFYSLYDVQNGSNENGEGRPEDRNAILRFAWPQAIADTLADVPHADVESLNF
ncbi:MAG: metallophosphoesterase [Deltaproteobacteria bacterium]|nr:metallophosphoesterase [Deltaproteobacteria bacterium]